MQKASFEARLLEHTDTLTDSQRAVAEAILANPEEAAFLTAAKLAKQADVSETTVMRLVATLEYNGWPELQRALQDNIKARLTTLQRLSGAAVSRAEGYTTIARVMLADVDCISEICGRITGDDFDRALDMIEAARTIKVIGVRSVAPIADYLAMGLDWILSNTQALTCGREDWVEKLADLSEADLLIALTFPRYARLTRDVVRHCRTTACRVLAITDGVLSPVAPYADHLLIAGCSLESYIDSYVGPLSLINALLTATAERQPEKTHRNLERLEEGWRIFRVFCE